MSIDNIEVENQIDVAPFPILLSQRAPDKKKSMPFLSMEVYMVARGDQKNLIEKNLANKIKYISSVNLYIGSLDIKIDDQTVQICMEMSKRLNLTKSQTELDEMRLGTIQKFKPVYIKLEDKETSVKGVSRVYIKMLNIEPVEINLTFRAASKLDQNTIANNFFADFGLIFASIKDASIELKGFKITHIFGTSDLLLKTIYLYYKTNVRSPDTGHEENIHHLRLLRDFRQPALIPLRPQARLQQLPDRAVQRAQGEAQPQDIR